MSWLHPFWYGLLDFFGVRNEAGPGYGFFSGIGSDIGEVTLIGAVYLGVRHVNCHVTGCRAVLRTHPVVGTPFRACRKHHPAIPEGDITPETIEAAHVAAQEA